MSRLAVDTSVAVPYVLRSHTAHDEVTADLEGVETVLTAHSLAETYSVLTRLPGDARLAPDDAARLIDVNMGETVTLSAEATVGLHHRLARRGIAGGGVYDALVGLAARLAGLPLATRDARAVPTYAALDVEARPLGDVAR